MRCPLFGWAKSFSSFTRIVVDGLAYCTINIIFRFTGLEGCAIRMLDNLGIGLIIGPTVAIRSDVLS